MDRKQSAFVMRFSDRLLPFGATTVGEHNSVFSAKGKVWLGKMGRAVLSRTLAYDPEIHDFYLVLIRSFGGGRRKTSAGAAYIGAINCATVDRPPSALVPKYYRKHMGKISAWFCLKEPLQYIDRKELMMWTVRSSGKAVIDSMSRGTASFFIADRQPGQIVYSNEPVWELCENDPGKETSSLLDVDVLDEEERGIADVDVRELLRDYGSGTDDS